MKCKRLRSKACFSIARVMTGAQEVRAVSPHRRKQEAVSCGINVRILRHFGKAPICSKHQPSCLVDGKITKILLRPRMLK
ncbi:hypothetical protein OBBRIDRAFT_415411 [Obba rivulosa]|uniref:Uncharacterized protein n=1 Tax=Obba rivulosa TaxID=1052685 RepID=A0A8E2AHL8_9APHY|nr:hypothetical protein OBBRIDRAFT_415411 [Obba rivulosa]